MLLSETHVTSDVDLCELNIDGYRMEQSISNNCRTGGVMAFIRSDICYKVKTLECVDNYVWILSVELCLSRVKYLCFVLYHPPQKDDSRFVEYFTEYLGQVSDFGGTNIIVGDLNFDLMKNTFYGNKIMSNIYTSGFTQIVKGPTRIVPRSQTLIDYIVTNDKHLLHRVHLTPKISDHSILSITLNNRKIETQDTTKYQRSWKNYSCDKLQQELIDIDWDTNVSDINILADSFVSDVENIVDRMCP